MARPSTTDQAVNTDASVEYVLNRVNRVDAVFVRNKLKLDPTLFGSIWPVQTKRKEWMHLRPKPSAF